MTELETLYACRNHWQWLMITGNSNKNSYEISLKWEYRCICCEYTLLNYPLIEEKFWDCNMCPLTGFAWIAFKDKIASFCDMDKDSFYYGWINSISEKDKIYWASRMVYACNLAIEAIILNNK